MNNCTDFDTEVNRLFRELAGESLRPPSPASLSIFRSPADPELVADVVSALEKGQLGGKWQRLSRGDWKAAGNYESLSDADFAMACYLVRLGLNGREIHNVMEKSGLAKAARKEANKYTNKRGEVDYLSYTIRNAFAYERAKKGVD